MLDAIRERQPTFTIGAITALLALMNHRQARSDSLASLKSVYSGGAPIAPAVVEQFEAKFGALSVGVPTCATEIRIVDAETAVPLADIAGASGVVGTSAVDAYLAAGRDVVALSRRVPEVDSDRPFQHLVHRL